MVKKSFKKFDLPTLTVERLKTYGYSAAIFFGILSMSTVLLFGSPTFALSPATRTLDYYLYPVSIVIGIASIWAILTGRLAVEKFEKPLVTFLAVGLTIKFSVTLLAAPSLLTLAFVESWYWLMIGIWTASFLAFRLVPALILNLSVYATILSVTVFHTWSKADPAILFDRLSDIAASNLRLATSLVFLIILGHLKHQWMAIEKEAVELRNMAHSDPLTGLPNRRRLNEVLQDAIAENQDYLTVIMFDLDGFKDVNDRFGHAMGDEVLRHISSLTKRCIRSGDTIGRWGGEEFLIICPNTSLTDGLRLAERLRHMMATYTVHRGQTVTGSFGVAERRPGETADELVARADKALYVAKSQGKNQVSSTYTRQSS